jgi:hypothetical protein
VASQGASTRDALVGACVERALEILCDTDDH